MRLLSAAGRVALVLAAGAALYAVRPGVVENGVRSPRAWLVVLGVLLAGRGVAVVLARRGAGPRASSAASLAVVGALAWLVLAPSFAQRELVEAFPVAASAAPVAPPPPAAPVVPLPSAAPAAAPVGPVLVSSGELRGIGHAATGRTALYEVDGAAVLRFDDVDVEGTPGPQVHLVPIGARGPDGGVALGPLKAERGSFSYALPAGVDVRAGWTVLVWCAPFDTPIAAAEH